MKPLSEPTPNGSEESGSESDEKDSAWVSIETELGMEELSLICQDIERLLRINPAYEFRRWDAVGDDAFHWVALNESNAREIDTRLFVEHLPDGIVVTYATGLKTRTTFRVAPGPGDSAGGGAKLVITDDYSGTPVADREKRMDEVDKSLTQWGRGLHRYFRQWKRWSGVAPWRWYMRRVWQPMRPLGRRVAFLLVVITALEFVVFLMVFAVFWLQLNK